MTRMAADETATDGSPVAYPGQPVTAPTPPNGDAVAWQWELCDTIDAGPDDCTPIGGATTNLWASPPTPTPAVIRVVITVDLDGAQIRAASTPFVAMPWPDGITPGATPTTTTAAATTVPSSTTFAVNAYGDPLGPITTASGPEGRFALAAATQTVDGPALASNRMAVLARWVALTTPTSGPGTVTATAGGYVVTVDDTTLTLTDFVVTDNVVTDLRVCVNDGTCRYASDIIEVTDTCQAGATGCPTITSASGGLTAMRRGVITIDVTPHLLYETIGARPVASITHESGTVHYEGGWFLIDLPSTPPTGATQPLTVTYTDGGTDTLTVTYTS